METVKGGGVIAVMLKKTSLRDLFDLEMDVHNKLKTYSHPTISPLFNERFVLERFVALSLSGIQNGVVATME